MTQINRFKDYDSVKGYTESTQLPKGGYVLKIMNAEVCENSNGQYIKISVDIAEGEYKDFYMKDWKAQESEDKKWRCNYLLNVPKDDGTEKDGWTKRRFKTFTNALEDSNSGYHFDWDSDKFKGKLIGGLFNIREYEYNGKKGKATNLAQVTTVEKIRSNDYSLPDDKLLPQNTKTATGDEPFMQVSEEATPF